MTHPDIVNTDRLGESEFRSTLPADAADLLLASGAVEGPYRTPKPRTVSTWQRIKRALRVAIVNHTSKVKL